MPDRPTKPAPRFSAAARERLAAALAQQGLGSGGAEPIPRRAGASTDWPLTRAQERLWLAERVLGATALYHVPLAAHLCGPLDVPALERALGELCERHEILHARLVTVEERPRFVCVSERPAVLRIQSLEGAELETALEAARAELRRSFDLEHEAPLRATLWRLSEQEHLLLLTLHHLACDGASMRILCEELEQLHALQAGTLRGSLAAPALQMADYALWERERASAEAVEADVAHFAACLEPLPPPLQLPLDRPRPARWTPAGGWRTRELDPSLGTALAELARGHGATPFQLFLAAFQALLLRLTGAGELVVGIPMAQRDRLELERLPGFLVNTLALPARLDGSERFLALLARVRESVLEASAHGAAPFERVLERLAVPRDPARTPLFDVMFDHRAGLPRQLALAGLSSGRLIDEAELHSGTSKVDLALYSEWVEERLRLSAEYRSDLFDAATIDRWLGHLEVLLTGIVADPYCPVAELPLLPADERALVLETWARGAELPGCDSTLHAAVQTWCQETPVSVALIDGTETLTYAELGRRVRRLARHLVNLGVQRGEPVALCLERSSRLVVTQLAVLEAGGLYLPLDPRYPTERLRFMLQDSGARWVVTEESLAATLPDSGARCLVLERERAAIEATTDDPLEERAGPDDPAYLIYTSGSTGTPKGVACPHRGVLRLFRSTGTAPATADWLFFEPPVRMLHLAPESFDASVLDTWGALATGGTLVLHPEARPTLTGLARVIEEHSIDTLFLTTALFHALVDEMPETLERLRQVATGGEALSMAHLRRARERCPGLRIVNCYGPTEATVMATAWVAPAEIPAELQTTPIGQPIANTRVVVLDEHLQPVPVGAPGELFIGGPSIASGYWKQPEQSERRFLPDPHAPGRLYRTGDRVRWRAGGALEFLGRVDDQLKIRGHRVEPGEVEAVLARHPSVGQALVLACRTPSGEQALVAYVVGEPAGEADLAEHVAQCLPEYLRPVAHVWLPELPLTPGGKVDRRRLPEPELGPRESAGEDARPRGPTEEILAQLWGELLGRPSIRRDDDFFLLGGHSLAATVLAARLRRHLEVELPLATLFRASKLHELARVLDQARGASRTVETIQHRPPSGLPAPLSFNQRGLWFLQQLAPGSAFYNVPFAVPLQGPLDVNALRQALQQVVQRHEVLRSSFPLVAGEPVQVVSAGCGEPRVLDLRARGTDERGPALQVALRDFAAEPFDLERGPLLRGLIVLMDEQRSTLAINVHHIAFDGWSLDVLLQELRTLYQAGLEGRLDPLPAPAIQYSDYCHWQRQEQNAQRAEADLEFWRQELSGAPLVLELPTDRPRPVRPSWRGARVQRALPASLVAGLQDLARREGATPYLVTLAVVEVLLARRAGVQDLLIGTPVAARTHAETQGAIGLYLNVLPIRARLDGEPSFREHLRRTRERVLAAHAHQDFPFERLVDALQERHDPAITPLYQVLFSLRRASLASESGGLRFGSAQEIDAGSAKTDLAITLEERDGDWLLDLTYATDLFDAATMERMAGHFSALLASALEQPERSVWSLEQLQPEERALLQSWSGRRPSYPREESLAELFQRAVERSPEATAVVFEGQTLSYRQLDRRSTRLARRLLELGVERETPVALCADRSPEMIVALLGILKAGGAYVPLDPAYPAERLTFMLQDSGAPVLLVDDEHRELLPTTGTRVLILQELEDGPDPLEDVPLETRAGAEQLAYVMYTSGSTGRPKGAQIEQRAISRLVFGADYARLDATRTWLQLAPISFDAATLEIWGALLHGAKLVLHPERVPTPIVLERVLKENQVTSLWLTAGLFNALIDERPQALETLQECLTGGEALSVAHVRRAQALLPGLQLINGYGPTENTTFTCCHRIPRPLPEGLPSIPIGRPIPNTTVHVVDRWMHPVPVGVAGELITGGDGVARGYLGQESPGRERFLPDTLGPLDPSGRARLYRTGDRVRWLADGTLEFLGRDDDQVKIRGHRIEPGEIAVVLGAHPALRKAFVSVHDSPLTGKSLVAYYETLGAAPPSPQELEDWLAERLPTYMIPASFMPVEALPMNANGKVDRKRLPQPSFDSRVQQRPRNELEHHLAALWEEVLGTNEIGPGDDFFDLGGHSLLAVKLVQRIRDAFGQELELSSLISAPTLAEQAQLLHQGVGSQRSSAVVQLQPRGENPPVFCVCSLGGTVLNQRPLALRLGSDQPFYGLQAIDLETRLGRRAGIEDYASAYIQAMKRVAPKGPYVVGGHSFGGIVSFEIAQQLTRQGDEVAMLFILDSSLPNLDKGALDRLACLLAFLRGLPYVPAEAWAQLRRDPEHLGRALRQKLRFVTGKGRTAKRSLEAARAELARQPAEPAPGREGAASAEGPLRVADVVEMSNWPEHNRRIAERHWRAVLEYQPTPYPGRITLFRSRFQSPFLGLGSQMGWDRVALGGVDVVRVPGGHLSVLQPPNVDVLARQFQERLVRRRNAA